MRKVLTLFLLFILFNNCERDDICAESTPSTPTLVINFNDDQNVEDPKNVTQLLVELLDDNGVVINTVGSSSTTNEIFLPLRIQDENETTPITTRYAITERSTDADNANTDIIEITYTTEFIYVSRACGFKSIFNLVTPSADAFNIEPFDGSAWTTNFTVENFVIENTNEAHIIIYH